MGEEPWRVHCTGCPSIDLIVDRDITLSEKIFNRNGGIGHPIDLSQPYILMVQHPVTTSFGEGLAQIQETLSALKSRPEQKIIIWPNIDAGSDDVSKGIRMFREKNLNEKFFYTRGFSPEDYVCVLKNAVCAVGNSSSFIREGAYLGVPVINIGDRQKGREHGDNIIFSDYSADDIGKKIVYQITHGRYPQSKIFGEGNAGKRIADVLATTDLNIEKRLTY
jgi:UDP-hydrolysing UDP-N-acetyl-D-glucosamine 2-epimerase